MSGATMSGFAGKAGHAAGARAPAEAGDAAAGAPAGAAVRNADNNRGSAGDFAAGVSTAHDKRQGGREAGGAAPGNGFGSSRQGKIRVRGHSAQYGQFDPADDTEDCEVHEFTGGARGASESGPVAGESETVAGRSGTVAAPSETVAVESEMRSVERKTSPVERRASERGKPRPADAAAGHPPAQGMTREDWRAMPKKFLTTALMISVMWLGLLSIYWGALYHRERRVGHMKYLVVDEDSSFAAGSNTSQPIVGPYLESMLASAASLGTFVVADADDFGQRAAAAGRTTTEELMREVHHQKYWGGIHIVRNSSAVVYESLVSGNTSSAASNASQSIISVYYESGRHFSALSQYVTRNVRNLSLQWDTLYAPQVSVDMLALLTSAQRTAIIAQSANSSNGVVFAYPPHFRLVDMRPAVSPAVLGPSELGLVYAQLFSFHQFNFAAELHNTVRERLRFRHFVFYRFCVSQFSHLLLALVYSLMTIAFRVSTSVAYGRSGFLVLWITMYLSISASGGWNECFGTLVTYKDKRFLQPAFIIFNIVVNISPTFAPYELLPGFYRYGYAIPMFNAYEALKVVFFDTWKGTLLRNYAVLLAWIAATNIILAYILLYISHDSKKVKAEKEKPEKTAS